MNKLIIKILWVFFLPLSLVSQEEIFDHSSIDPAFKEEANAVIRSQSLVIEIPDRRTQKVSFRRVITVLNKKGNNAVDAFVHYDPSNRIKKLGAFIYDASGDEIEKVKESDFEDVSAKTKTDETEFLNHLTASKAVLYSDLFEEKSDKTLEDNTTKQELSSIESIDNNSSSNEPKDAEAKLKIGSPLEFDKNETHSFSEWLSLSKAEPIKRITKNKVEETQGLPEKKPSRIERSIAKKNKLIEAFIAKNHKLEPKKNAENTVNLAKAQMIPREELMTETLARIYVEQKNYKKAIQSYNILSLKYPEKSGFFADQIKAVKQIQEKNNN